MNPYKNMLFLVLIVLCSHALGAIPKSFVRVDPNSTDRSIAIRVLLDKGVRQTRVFARRALSVQATTGQWIKFRSPVEIRLRSSSTRKHFRINGRRFNAKEVTLEGTAPNDKLKYRGRYYRGKLVLRRTGSAFTITNHLSLDTYLSGTLGNEMSSSWEMEALKAQAVVSRSYALHRISQPSHQYYDVQKTTLDQVYGGASTESERVHKAVIATRGMFLSHKGDPIKAYFHSRCGGKTERPENVWQQGDPAQRKNISCPYCQKYPYQWQYRVAKDTLRRALKMPASESFVLQPLRGPSGRIIDIVAKGKRAERKIRSNQLRSRLGFNRLKSTLFKWSADKSGFHFTGVGAGHGVGMCQWGARYLAQKGLHFKKILSHYYPDASLNVL